MAQTMEELQAEYDEFMSSSHEIEEELNSQIGLLETQNGDLKQQLEAAKAKAKTSTASLNAALDDAAKLREEGKALASERQRLEQVEEELGQSW